MKGFQTLTIPEYELVGCYRQLSDAAQRGILRATKECLAPLGDRLAGMARRRAGLEFAEDDKAVAVGRVMALLPRFSLDSLDRMHDHLAERLRKHEGLQLRVVGAKGGAE